MKVAQHLWFEKDMEAAIRLYIALVPGSELHSLEVLPSDTPSGPEGNVLVASFTLGDQRYRALQAGPFDPFNHSFSIVAECETQAEIDRLWDGLLDGGAAEHCGWLRDRWGVNWQIVPRRLYELTSGPDVARSRRVLAAMLGMIKLDIAALEAAAVE